MKVKLTKTERKIINLCATGHSQLEIAADLSISSRTVYFHTANIYAKLGVHSIVAALATLGTWKMTE